MTRLLRFLICISVFTLLGSFAVAEEFAAIKEIDGVREVEYLAPFLLVEIEHSKDAIDIKQRVMRIVDEREDPDIAAIDGPINIRCYVKLFIEHHKQQQKLVSEANSLAMLADLEKSSLFTSVYTLDWDTDTGALDEISRRLYVRNNATPSSFAIEREENVALNTITKCMESNQKPDKLLCMSLFYVGTTVYPVFKGKVKINNAAIPFADFAPLLANKTMHQSDS